MINYMFAQVIDKFSDVDKDIKIIKRKLDAIKEEIIKIKEIVNENRNI